MQTEMMELVQAYYTRALAEQRTRAEADAITRRMPMAKGRNTNTVGTAWGWCIAKVAMTGLKRGDRRWYQRLRTVRGNREWCRVFAEDGPGHAVWSLEEFAQHFTVEVKT